MRFESSSERMSPELKDRLTLRERILRWGVSYLDDALSGIFANDLVLLGAPPGVGKTALCTGIAHANLLEGKKVHFIALEAHKYEIERRIKFRYFCDLYWNDANRPQIRGSLNFKTWCLGEFDKVLSKYHDQTEEFCKKAYCDLFTLYKHSKFTITDLIKQTMSIASETDLIITDHAHYFDWNEDDNTALKNIVHTARDLTQDIGRPMILVAHLRKRDRGAKELVPGMDDFHGSSELAKVATKCVTIASGGVTSDKKYITYMRASKDRLDQGPSKFVGLTTFNPKKGWYDDEYKLTWASSEIFAELTPEQKPDWARNCDHSRALPPRRESELIRQPRRTGAFTRSYVPD